MATVILCAVRDAAIDSFLAPFTARHSNQAVRMFGDAINNADSEMKKHPDDYDLFVIGEFEEETGRVKPHDKPELLVRGKNLVRE